jgi:hypothetical protein
MRWEVLKILDARDAPFSHGANRVALDESCDNLGLFGWREAVHQIPCCKHLANACLRAIMQALFP